MRIKDILLLQEAPKYATVAWAKPTNDSVLLNIYNKGEWHPINSNSSNNGSSNSSTKTNSIADEFDWIGEVPNSLIVEGDIAQTLENIMDVAPSLGPSREWYRNWEDDRDPVTVVHYTDNGVDIYVKPDSGTIITNDTIYLRDDTTGKYLGFPIKYRYVIMPDLWIMDAVTGAEVPDYDVARLTDVLISSPNLVVLDTMHSTSYTFDKFHIFYLLIAGTLGSEISLNLNNDPGRLRGVDITLYSTYVCHDNSNVIDFYFELTSTGNVMRCNHQYVEQTL